MGDKKRAANQAGFLKGRVDFQSLDRATREALSEVLEKVQEFLDVEENASPASPYPEAPESLPSSPEASYPPGENPECVEVPPFQDTLQDIEIRFRQASREWDLLFRALDQVRDELAHTEFEDALGRTAQEKGPAQVRPSGGGSQEDEAEPEVVRVLESQGTEKVTTESTASSTEEPQGLSGLESSEHEEQPPREKPPTKRLQEEERPSEERVESECDSPEPADPAGETEGSDKTEDAVVEKKLDELITLVRNKLETSHSTQSTRDAPPEGWTSRIAWEVVRQLQQNMRLSEVASNESESGERESKSAKRKRIAIDDVTGIIDDITGRNR
jgi:hypothetical protein